MRILRFLSIGALAITALMMLITGGRQATEPVSAEADSYRAQIEEALANSVVNEISADTAPKQQVVNGWVARDLLAVQGQQLADLAQQVEILSVQTGEAGRDDRVPGLLGIMVILLCLIAARSGEPSVALSSVAAPPADQGRPPAPVVSAPPLK